ncbi:MAG: CsbD family protein [Allosphingosinicella sp.]|uniref:CsbD family protein n=1 Tax=Allosphingosinicella sp. TaxID=2823234 RepID=UPI003947960A
MNIDTLAGEGTNLKGRFKESLGDAVGDPALRRDGIADQAAGSTRKLIGAVRDFVRDQPIVAAALFSVAGAALLSRLRHG